MKNLILIVAVLMSFSSSAYALHGGHDFGRLQREERETKKESIIVAADSTIYHLVTKKDGTSVLKVRLSYFKKGTGNEQEVAAKSSLITGIRTIFIRPGTSQQAIIARNNAVVGGALISIHDGHFMELPLKGVSINGLLISEQWIENVHATYKK